MHIWKLTEAGKTRCHKEWSFYCMDATFEFYSSFKKIKKVIKDTVKLKQMSKDNWTEYHRESKDYCYVINSGGSAIFSIRKIYIK
jgi:predicted DNA-binding ArsR family transcriptional regulator